MIEKTFPITDKLLSSGLKSTQKLFELLHAEYEQLKALSDPNVLGSLAAHKKEIVVQLEQFSKQLCQVLATEKLVATQDGMQRYLATAQSNGINIADSQRCWHEIVRLSKNCQTLNEQNGASIDLLSRHTQRALQIMRGKPQLHTTYGPDGSTRSELFSRTLVSV
jgi:flagella synthesis protein FlgN